MKEQGGAGSSGSNGRREMSVEECLQAGKYFFARGERDKARKWWHRALTLDPSCVRARESLVILERTEVVPKRPLRRAQKDERAELYLEPLRPSNAPPPYQGTISALSEDPLPTVDEDALPGSAAPSDDLTEAAALPPSAARQQTPWDYGPAQTSAVEVRLEDGGAVPSERTPMPFLDRAPLFETHSKPRQRSDSTGSGADGYKPGGPAVRLDPAELLKRARDRYALDDFEGALTLLEQIEQPSADEELLLKETRNDLKQVYVNKIGQFEVVPQILMSDQEIIWLNLNHRAGYILSQIDGQVSYEDLVALSGMPQLDTLRILYTLIKEGVIGSRQTDGARPA